MRNPSTVKSAISFDIFSRLKEIIEKSELDLVNSRKLLDRMKPDEVEEATHLVMVEGLMQEEVLIELDEVLDGITREVFQVKGTPIAHEVRESRQEDERIKVLRDENQRLRFENAELRNQV